MSDQSERRVPQINFNSALLTIMLALSAWTLKSVSDLSIAMAVGARADVQHDGDLASIKSRLNSDEIEIQKLALEIVKLQDKK